MSVTNNGKKPKTESQILARTLLLPRATGRFLQKVRNITRRSYQKGLHG